MSLFKNTIITLTITLLLTGCKNGKLPGSDARKIPYDPKERVKRNLEQGKGFRLNNMLSNNKRGGDFQFASSNELWRATLDVIDFMPLASANYSGGMIITDWYLDSDNPNESIKIMVRFLTNEIRSDALDIKVFHKNCGQNDNCQISEKKGSLVVELNKKILSRAAVYEKETKDKSKKKYTGKMAKGLKKK